jgi:hypothetical protein
MISKWLEEYNPKTEEQLIAGLREIVQEVALADLYRAAFFKAEKCTLCYSGNGKQG